MLFCKDSAGGTCYELQFVTDGTPCKGADPEKDYESIYNVTFVMIVEIFRPVIL